MEHVRAIAEEVMAQRTVDRVAHRAESAGRSLEALLAVNAIEALVRRREVRRVEVHCT